MKPSRHAASSGLPVVLLLALIDDANEFRGFDHGVEGANVEPGESAIEFGNGEPSLGKVFLCH